MSQKRQRQSSPDRHLATNSVGDGLQKTLLVTSASGEVPQHAMKVAYRLRDNPKHIAQVQKATLTTDNFGIESTDGLFGSPEWWDRISTGDLPVHTLSGTIAERFMGSMGDWPEITVLSDGGEKSSWTREVNRKEQDALYRVGRRIEIDYVLQRHRIKSSSQKKEHKVVLEIRVEPDAEGDVPGFYEKLLAKETAHRVLTAPILLVLEASYQLAELGRTPRVMPNDVHRVFVDACAECDRLIGGRQFPNDPEAQRIATQRLQELEARWKDHIFAACRRIVEDQS